MINLSNRTILAARDGVQIVSAPETFDGLAVYAQDNLYSVYDYRPLNGEGRQLRESSRATINAIRSEAIRALEALNANANNNNNNNGDDSASAEIIARLRAEAEINAAYTRQLEEELAEARAAQPAKPLVHRLFNRILGVLRAPEEALKANDKYFYLYGPSGSGKSYLAAQIAEALNLPFYAMRSISDIYSLVGYNDAGGRYIETDFYRAFSGGGLFFLDEIDCSDAGAVKALNDALANRAYSFPCGSVTASERFYCLAAGNTTGRGGNIDYIGNSLDESSRNRFGFLRVDYDERIELQQAHGDAELVEYAHLFREACKAAQYSAVCTYRDLARVSGYIALGWEIGDALTVGTLAGMEPEDIRGVWSAMGDAKRNNKYCIAFKALGEEN